MEIKVDIKKREKEKSFLEYLEKTRKETSTWPDWIKQSANYLFEENGEGNNSEQAQLVCAKKAI